MKEEELNSIYYFWFEKGNLERWTDWDKVKDKYPEIQEAWMNYKKARKNLSDIIKECSS